MKMTIDLLAAALLLACAASALASVHYVDVNSTNATPPFTNWATAASNIQDAVDAAVTGDEVVVTNGTYANGGRSLDGVTTNRVDVGKPLALRSVNGPQVTTVFGGSGRSSIRCVHLTPGASMSGFTLTSDLFSSVQGSGGGLLCDDETAVVSNCVISGNGVLDSSNRGFGGGACGGTLNNCTLIGNTAGGDAGIDYYGNEGYGGGAYACTLNNCNLIGNSAIGATLCRGGGAFECRLNNCTLTGNSASLLGSFGEAYGDGADLSTLNNCMLSSNYWLAAVTAASSCTLNNCTVTYGGGGALGCTLNNCIVYSNYINYDYTCTLNYCCTTPQPTNGVGNITNAPLFVNVAGNNLRLQSNSPCINAGNNAFAPAGPDLDGNPRIAGGTVDIGSYEFQSPVSKISYAWLQQYGLPINTSTDTADPDGDGVDNYHEWLAGTIPTNSLSSPAHLTISPSGIPPSGIILTWSTNAVDFTLQSTTNLFSPSAWVTNSPAPAVIAGQNTVTNPIAGAQQFYRLIH